MKAVEAFLNEKTPLSQGIAKQASDMGFNSEQVKRTVEATNNIAYLKMLGMTEDRSFEFPVADFKEVMAHILMPEGVVENVESESTKEVMASFVGPTLEKAASVVDDGSSFVTGLTKEAQIKFLLTESSVNKANLENLSGYSSLLAEKLVKQAQVVGQDPQGMDKLASVTDEDQFTKLSYLIAGEVKPYRDLGKYGMFKEAGLRQVKQLSELHKEASELVQELAVRKHNQERLDVLLKEAAAPTSSLPKAPKIQAGSALAQAGSTIAGSTLGGAVGKAVKTVAKVPLNIVKNPGKTLAFAGGPVLDDLFYSPGNESTTGRPNDAWSALHS